MYSLYRYRRIRTSLLQMGSALVLFGLMGLIPLQAQPLEPLSSPIHRLSAEHCRDCHREIYNEWAASMHAKSTALYSPIHEAMYRREVGDPRQDGQTTRNGAFPVCLQCHAPSAAMDGRTKLDALPVYGEGVTCVTCHTMKSYQGIHAHEGGQMNLGIKAYSFSEVLQGPSGRVFSTRFIPPPPRGIEAIVPTFHPFPMEGNAALLRSADACLGCHDQRNNPHGVPLCMTGAEFRQSSTFNCQQCHMPVVDGRVSHNFYGGYDTAMLRRSVILTMQAAREQDSIEVNITLQNMLPHNMPTGAPFRNAFLRVSAYDSFGILVWANFRQHPLPEDPKAMLMLTLVDEDGKPAPPPQAKAIGTDTRLQPHESRDFVYQIPAQNVAVVRTELNYDLLLPAMKAMFDNVPDDLKQARVIAKSEQRIY